MKTTARRALLVIAITATIGCDRITKHIATSALAGLPDRSYLSGIVRLQYAENAGGFLGIGRDLPAEARTVIFTVATGLALLLLLVFAIRQRMSGWPLFGLSVFIGGGASNWADRVATGTVVDFMVIGLGPVRTGIFNVADVAIMCGIGVLVVAECRRRRALRRASWPTRGASRA